MMKDGMKPSSPDTAPRGQNTSPKPLGDAAIRRAFEQAPLILNIIDADMNIVDVSDFLLESTMKRREDVCGRNIFEAFPDDPSDPAATGVNDLRESLERVFRQGKQDWMAVQCYPMELPGGGGFERRYWSPMNVPVRDEGGRVTHVLQIVQEVTEFVELKQRNEELSATAEALEERRGRMEAEILKRSRELKIVNSDLHNASAAKNEFLSRMSHELRTPLSAIMGFSELMQLSETDPKRSEWLASILKASRLLVELVNEVLDISRIESGDLDLSLESVSVDATIEDALQLMCPLAARQGIELSVTPSSHSSYVLADAQRLKQVLINLISNGIKYNEAGGSVVIAVHKLAGGVGIHVSDTGTGLRPDQLEKIFEPFERLDASTRGVDGTGLGLALSRNLVEAMGGSVTVQSELDEGSTFKIQLRESEPVAVVVRADANASVVAVKDYASQRKLLYIDDTATNLRLMEDILRLRPSVTLMSAMLGQLGVELAREHLPDLILLDLHLPDLGGKAVLEALAADPATSSIPVLILSADATMREHDAVVLAGAREYLTKPITVEQLLKTVDRYVEV